MSALKKAVDEMKFRIPIQVLQLAFQDEKPNWRRAPISLDERILNAVIKPRVLVDSNLLGGQTIMLSLAGLNPSYIDTYTVIYEIPAERLAFRTLISVLSVGYMPYNTTFNSLGGGSGIINPNSLSDLSTVANRVADSFSSVPVVSNASVEIVGTNTIMLRDQLRVTNAYLLNCIVENEENLNNINVRSWLTFADLCEHAVKSYIYNKLIIQIDNAYLSGGQELGSVKSYVDTLSDSEQNYRTFLYERWRPCMMMNDAPAHRKFIKLQLGGLV